MSEHGGWIGFGGGSMWLILVLVIVAIIWGIKANSSIGSSAGQQAESPQDILKKRFARGEIDEDEFNRKLRKLEEK